MGILDSKSRVMDTIVTLEGRQQIVGGKLNVAYVSFTDAGTYYRADLASGSADASVRLYFEQNSLPQDQITFEADDSGRLRPFGNAEGIQVKDGQILEYSFNALTASLLTGSNQGLRFLKGEEFASTAEMLLASSIDNFKRLQVIGTIDRIFEDDGFALSNPSVTFTVTNDRPIVDPNNYATHIDHLESLFNDVRLSKLRNFKYLPPINTVDDATINKKDHRETSKYQLGHYRPWGRSHVYGLSPAQLETELSFYDRLGYARTINFDPTSRDNRLVAQFFEVNFNTLRKLDVIDYGPYSWKGGVKHAFFIGKVLVDNNETNTFVHLFTLIFG